jgi:hypothetical protein
MFHWKSSGECLKILLLGCSRRKFGCVGMKDLECRYHRFRGDAFLTAQSGLKLVNSADGRQSERGTAAVFDRFRLVDSNQPDDVAVRPHHPSRPYGVPVSDLILSPLPWLTKSRIATRESLPIACPAFFNNRACRP